MSDYEFSKKEEQTIASLGQRMAIVGGLLVVTGIGRIILGFVRSGGEGFGGGVIVFLTAALFNIVLGVVFFRPTDNLKRIATTTGNDIKELMTAFSELASGFDLVNYALILIAVLAIVNIFVS